MTISYFQYDGINTNYNGLLSWIETATDLRPSKHELREWVQSPWVLTNHGRFECLQIFHMICKMKVFNLVIWNLIGVFHLFKWMWSAMQFDFKFQPFLKSKCVTSTYNQLQSSELEALDFIHYKNSITSKILEALMLLAVSLSEMLWAWSCLPTHI